MPKFDDRFARQNRYGPPPEFPLASACSGIVHHLSGPNKHALARPLGRGLWDRPAMRLLQGSRLVCLHCAFGFRTAQHLARVLDSLVRVSRRVGDVASLSRRPLASEREREEGLRQTSETASSFQSRFPAINAQPVRRPTRNLSSVAEPKLTERL